MDNGCPKISVIVPVYNSEKYIQECIDSILKQSFNDVEILIIDDGSTDQSWQIIRDNEEKYHNVRSFKQERKRQGAARNVGLDNARGEYISFVDSDDLLPRDAYARMYQLITAHQSELVTGIKKSYDKQRRWRPGRKMGWITIPEHEQFFTHVRESIRLDDLPELLVDISVCNKLIKRSFLEANNLRFVEDSAGEDIDFMARVYMLAEKISVLPEVIYHYCSRPASRTSRIAPAFFDDRVRVIERLEAFFEEHGKHHFYQLLVLSELRKLVKGRLTRVIQTLGYGDQLAVFAVISRLLDKVDEEDIIGGTLRFEPLAQLRLLMLASQSYDALIAFTLQPRDQVFVHQLSDDRAEHYLLPIISYYQEKLHARVQYNLVTCVKSLIVIFLSFFKKIKSLPKGINKRNMAIIPYLAFFPYGAIVKKLSRKPIWIIDERISTSAEDNSFVLFEYLTKNRPEISVYYLINKKSKDREKVMAIGKVLSPYSLKHALLLARASVLLSTDRFSSLAYPYSRFSFFHKSTHNVFLQHGVAGNKTMTYTKQRYSYFNQVVVSNEIERDFFVKKYGFSDREVTVTGIARFDRLSSGRDGKLKKKILVAPTWRKWLRTREQVAISKYLYCWNQLMQETSLISLVREHDVALYFRPHFNMVEFIDDFESGSGKIHILRQDKVFLQDYIRECDLLITDYSSVMYDFFFQEKPVICYMFDRPHWEAQSPGPPHIDFDTQLPAAIASSPREVTAALREIIGRGFKMSVTDRNKAAVFFTYRDNRNCERIYRSVRELASEHST